MSEVRKSGNRRALRCLLVLGLTAGAAAAIGALTASGGPAAAAVGHPRSSARVSLLAATPAQVAQAVRAAVHLKVVPDHVRPPLQNASNDNERIYYQDCPAAQKAQDAQFGECVYGPPSGKKLVVLFGDSHAGMWFDGIRGAVKIAGQRLRIFYHSACVAPSITLWSQEHRAVDKDCDSWRARAIKAIRAVRPDIVIVTSASYLQHLDGTHFATGDQWRTALETTLRRLAAPRRRLIVLGDLPVPRQPVPECIAAHLKSVGDCATTTKDALADVLVGAERAAARSVGARYVDVTPWFCATLCPPIINGIVVYRNQFHITATYSLYLRGVLRQGLGL
jgi:hypothetical protein